MYFRPFELVLCTLITRDIVYWDTIGTLLYLYPNVLQPLTKKGKYVYAPF